MAKPTQGQFKTKEAEIEDIAEVVHELRELPIKVNNLMKTMTWSEIPASVYDRIFTKYQELVAELKTLVNNL